MLAIMVQEYGGPEVLRPVDIPVPRYGPGEVLVEVEASGVNFLDVYRRDGRLPVPLPHAPGTEFAGTVAATGADVTGVGVGDRVAGVLLAPAAVGAHAECTVVPAHRLVPVPDGLAPEIAAGALVQGMTAHYLTHDTYPVQPGDTVLVHAAAGGTGLMITQFAKLLGARVIGTVSTREKETVAREAGADEVIRYPEVGDVGAEVRRLTEGRGVAAVYDGVGRTTFETGIAALRTRGVLVLYGEASGPVPPFDLARLVDGRAEPGRAEPGAGPRPHSGSLYVTRPSLVHHAADPALLRMRADEVLSGIVAGRLSVHIGGRYPLERTADAHRDLEAGRSTGKLVVVP